MQGHAQTHFKTLQREPHNHTDKLAVAVMKSGITVGHVPYNLAPIISSFLKRSFNKGMAEITGDKVNRGGGHGLKVPCTYRLYGPRAYIERAEKMFAEDKEKTRMRLGSGSGLPED